MSESLDLYSAELDRKPYKPLSNAALTALLGEALDGSQEAWQALWGHGLRMVLKIVNKLEEKELLKIPRDEAIAVGNLSIGEALLSWIPKKGAYATWVWVNIRQEILKANQEYFPESLIGDDGEDLLEWTEVEHSLGLRDPDEETLMERIEALPRAIREVMNLHMCEISHAEIALMLGVSRQRINKLYHDGVEMLRDSYSV